MRRTMVAVAGVAATAAAVLSAPTSAAAASCVITALPVPEGTNFSRVNGVDPTGRFLAGFVGSDTVGHRRYGMRVPSRCCPSRWTRPGRER